jgi:predicted 3-demethylubiquinone-9 3-methyltransferase (glyoxalase superfamily)
MQKITTFLWFDKQAEEAMNFYVDVFNGAPNKKAESKVGDIMRYPEGGEGPMAGMDGKVLTGAFELAGQKFMALDGGPIFTFTEAVSLFVDVADQQELDYFWDALSAVPESEQCGWLKDKYGLSWQIIPSDFAEIMSNPDPEKAGRAQQAMLQMKKLDIQKLKDAAEGK